MKKAPGQGDSFQDKGVTSFRLIGTTTVYAIHDICFKYKRALEGVTYQID